MVMHRDEFILHSFSTSCQHRGVRLFSNAALDVCVPSCGVSSRTGEVTLFPGFVARPRDMKGSQDGWHRAKTKGSSSNQPQRISPLPFWSLFPHFSALIETHTWRTEPAFVTDLLFPQSSMCFSLLSLVLSSRPASLCSSPPFFCAAAFRLGAEQLHYTVCVMHELVLMQTLLQL